MRDEVQKLNDEGIKTIACCCGHGKYKKTIVVPHKSDFWAGRCAYEVLSGTTIPRKKRIYKRDPEGFYFIPEVEETRG
jgi:hypothetical protein